MIYLYFLSVFISDFFDHEIKSEMQQHIARYSMIILLITCIIHHVNHKAVLKFYIKSFQVHFSLKKGSIVQMLVWN